MSVVRLLTDNHAQAIAYVTGATCAETLIEEYGLNSINYQVNVFIYSGPWCITAQW